MVDEKAKRKYELRQRAETMDVTRRRITDATVELHGTIGPARTTIAGIAALAGVQRHTVYRHFATDEELFAACSTQYWTQNPWPATEKWRTIDAGPERLAVALGELYTFYAAVEPMMTNALRDAETVPIVERALEAYRGYLDDVVLVLAQAFPPGAARTVLNAAIRHAIGFRTWQSLVRLNGLAPEDAVRLMAAMVASAHG
jgi:AcrR family transcriptional regulator